LTRKCYGKKQLSEPNNAISVITVMKINQILKLIFILIVLNAAIFATPAEDQKKKAADPDSTNQQKKNQTALHDTTHTLSDTTWLSTVKGKAMIRLSTWDNQEIIEKSVVFNVEKYTPQLMLAEMTRQIMTSDPQDSPDYDFRSSTTYRMDAAQEYVVPEHHKRNDILWVCAPEVVQAASDALKNDSNEEAISLSENEIGILKVLWRNSDISAKEWYKLYVLNSNSRRMSYLAFIQEVSRLEAKDLINVEEIEETQYFSPTISRSLLVWLARQELIASDVIFNTARHYELLKMQESLENVESAETPTDPTP